MAIRAYKLEFKLSPVVESGGFATGGVSSENIPPTPYVDSDSATVVYKKYIPQGGDTPNLTKLYVQLSHLDGSPYIDHPPNDGLPQYGYLQSSFDIDPTWVQPPLPVAAIGPRASPYTNYYFTYPAIEIPKVNSFIPCTFPWADGFFLDDYPARGVLRLKALFYTFVNGNAEYTHESNEIVITLGLQDSQLAGLPPALVEYADQTCAVGYRPYVAGFVAPPKWVNKVGATEQ